MNETKGFTLYDYDKLKTENSNLKRKKLEEHETLQKAKEKFDSTLSVSISVICTLKLYEIIFKFDS